MELKYSVIMYLGFVIAAIVFILAFVYKRKPKEKDSIKIANTNLILEDKLIKKQMLKYYILRVMLVLSVVLMIILTAVILARPYYIKKIKEQKYNRDIILCMDISSSVDDLNLKLVSELQDTVRSLSGERIGIVIFNTTPVVLSPLTDNYEYTIEQLENIKTAIKSQNSKLSFSHSSDWLYWNEYLYGGTLIGNELRGSSLIGDGLLGGLFAFPDMESDRTKIIILSTDNDPYGEGFVTLMEAAEYCKRNDVTVYGIGTRSMYTKDMDEMEKAVKLTGGKFFLEEKSSEFHEIVEDIEETSESLAEGKTIIKLIESPEKYFKALVIVFILFVVLSLILRRGSVLWSLGCVGMAVLLVLTYVYAVIPAKQFSKGPDLEMKKSSNLNVLFVIDNTISMLADDANGTRLDKVKSDVCQIVEELEGARFSVISFNNDAMVLAPYSQDIAHVENAVRSMYPIRKFYAKGSTLDTPKELMLKMLKEIKTDDKQKTAVIYISDGEITADGATLGSFGELSRYIDAGMVLGYGTKEGGTMTIEGFYEDEEDELVMDYDEYPAVPAVSRIDENNLESIAKDMGVEYINMNDVWISDDFSHSGKLSQTVKKLNSLADTKEEKIEHDNKDEYINPPVYYGFYALVPFAVLVILNAAYIIRKK